MLQVLCVLALAATGMAANLERSKRGFLGEQNGYSYEQPHIPHEQPHTVQVPVPQPYPVIKEVIRHVDRPVPQVCSNHEFLATNWTKSVLNYVIDAFLFIQPYPVEVIKHIDRPVPQVYILSIPKNLYIYKILLQKMFEMYTDIKNSFIAIPS